MRLLNACSILVAALVIPCVLAPPMAHAQKKIAFVAGPKDHGRANRHEYEKDLTALKGCVESANVTTVLFSGQAPDARELGDVAAVVLESSGDRIPREVHAIFPQDATTDSKTYDASTMERLDSFDALMKKGVGLVGIHYTTWVNNETGRKFWLDWLGGVADYTQDDSKVMVANWNVKPVNTTHPILRGITPWSYREEFFTNELMPPDPRRTPLIEVTKAEGGDTYVVGWAVERPGGGRGFVFTGSDFHANMATEQHRRLLANAILWAAKADVPAGGVSCAAPQSAIDAANAPPPTGGRGGRRGGQ